MFLISIEDTVKHANLPGTDIIYNCMYVSILANLQDATFLMAPDLLQITGLFHGTGAL